MLPWVARNKTVTAAAAAADVRAASVVAAWIDVVG
jgi:hypothetical protein